MKQQLLTISLAMLLLLMTGCFTGIESTPKIRDKELKNLPELSPAESIFTGSITSEQFADWKRGKRFRVTDPRIGIVFTSSSSPADSLRDREIVYDSVSETISVTGDSVYEIKFTDASGSKDYFMRVNSLQNVEVPFTVEMSLVDKADSLLRGRTLYVVTPMWYDSKGEHTVSGGRRHIAVNIDSVVAGNSVFPALVVFTPSDEAGQYALYMSVGARSNATRNFHTLFAFNNPRMQYPDITDEVWNKIIRSRVQLEMTPDECRLALGAPNVIRQLPTTAGMMEQWVYDDGKYLIFEDGFLVQFRQ